MDINCVLARETVEMKYISLFFSNDAEDDKIGYVGRFEFCKKCGPSPAVLDNYPPISVAVAVATIFFEALITYLAYLLTIDRKRKAKKSAHTDSRQPFPP